ncbi:hypothetical protein I4U23_005170 [Adineta vaga]|nr:hypothetical protein I4U23_005170 [Adineta vaga]
MEEGVFEFRILLIQLFNQLSDNHREEFHFIVGSIVPRKLRDDCTPAGSLRLLEFLFDRTLISNHHFDYLIHVFHEIGFYDAVERLEEFKKCPNYKQRTSSTTSTEATTLSIETDQITIVRDKSCSFSMSEKIVPNTDCTSLLSKTIVSSESKSSVFHIKKTMKSQMNIFTILLLITNLFSIVFFTLLWTSRCHISSVQLNSKNIVYSDKEGFWHGVKGKFIVSKSFDDDKDLILSNTDRCIAVEVYWINNYLSFIQFFYSNNRSSLVQRPSKDNQLNRVSYSFNRFNLNMNEEINKVIFYEHTHRLSMNNTFQKKYVVVGIQFRTTKGRKSDLFGTDDGNFTVESFVGYKFRYAKGQQLNDKRIEIFQLVWFKSTFQSERIDEPFLHELDTCSFNYTSEMANQSRRATGVESSWHDLKYQFSRTGESCRPGATYYRTISFQGPYLFAVVDNNYVFYHDAGKWTQYESANSITFGIIHSPTLHPERVSSKFNE